ncbi:MAG TPA: hypothetical protein VF122_06690, partial [Caulobacteraceae bacterium]
DSPRQTTRKNWLWLVLVAAVVLAAVIWWSATQRGEDIGGQIAMDSADMADTAPTDAPSPK